MKPRCGPLARGDRRARPRIFLAALDLSGVTLVGNDNRRGDLPGHGWAATPAGSAGRGADQTATPFGTFPPPFLAPLFHALRSSGAGRLHYPRGSGLSWCGTARSPMGCSAALPWTGELTRDWVAAAGTARRFRPGPGQVGARACIPRVLPRRRQPVQPVSPVPSGSSGGMPTRSSASRSDAS